MVRLVALIALAACGRLGFESRDDGAVDTTDDDVLLGHDEDGDGVPDDQDTCPHIVAPQDDGDGDRVGDACDPRPALAGEQILRFDPMTGTHPFTFDDPNTDGTFSQTADSLRFTGTLGVDGNLFGSWALPLVVMNVRIVLGFDILTVIPGAMSGQNQIALHVHDGSPPGYFVELNQELPMFDVATITHFDGANFTQTDPQDLASGMHPGPVMFQTTEVVNTGIVFEVGWPGEMYTSQVNDTLYQGATLVEMDINNVELEIRYLLVITSP